MELVSELGECWVLHFTSQPGHPCHVQTQHRAHSTHSVSYYEPRMGSGGGGRRRRLEAEDADSGLLEEGTWAARGGRRSLWISRGRSPERGREEALGEGIKGRHHLCALGIIRRPHKALRAQ